MHRFISLAIVSCLGLYSSAQVSDSGAHTSVALRFGLNQVKELNLLPKVHRGTITELTYGYERRRGNWDRFYFNLGYSRIRTKLEDVATSANLKLDLNLARHWPLAGNGKFHYFVGPALSLSYNASIYALWDDSHFYWADYLSLGVSGIVSVKVRSQNRWITSLAFPLVAAYSRPELYRDYKIDKPDPGAIIRDLNSSIKPGHPGNVFFMRFQTEYRFPVFNGKSEGFTYTLHFERLREGEGRAFMQLIHQVGIKFYL